MLTNGANSEHGSAAVVRKIQLAGLLTMSCSEPRRPVWTGTAARVVARKIGWPPYAPGFGETWSRKPTVPEPPRFRFHSRVATETSVTTHRWYETMTDSKPPITDAERRQVLDLRIRGNSYETISEKTGLSRRRIESILRHYFERGLVETKCVSCPAIIRQWIRPFSPRLHRCSRCARDLWVSRRKEEAGRDRSLLLDTAYLTND